MRYFLLFALFLATLGGSTAHATALGQLPRLDVGPYSSDKNGTLTGPYQAVPLPFIQTYKNTSSTLQDSLAFTVQAFGPGYSQGLTKLFGALQAVGANGGQDAYNLGELELPGPGSYLVQTNVFIYDRKLKVWADGPSRVYWLFPLVATPLPVRLVSFTAAPERDSVTLKWTTASEANCYGFWLERSTDGVTFAPYSFTASQGALAAGSPTRHYHARAGVVATRTYYRLRQVDIGGHQEYSPVVTVAPARPTATLASIYPNPATGQVHVAGAAGATAKLYNATGQLNREQLLDASEVLDLRGLPAGTYLLMVGSQRARLATY